MNKFISYTLEVLRSIQMLLPCDWRRTWLAQRATWPRLPVVFPHSIFWWTARRHPHTPWWYAALPAFPLLRTGGSRSDGAVAPCSRSREIKDAEFSGQVSSCLESLPQLFLENEKTSNCRAKKKSFPTEHPMQWLMNVIGLFLYSMSSNIVTMHSI